jgi:TM2 domain-containing membrane protein YozV
LLSAVVPGAGKVYAGQLGQGVAIFLQNTIFALQAYEGYRKDGPRSARFLIYGGLFTVFYIGNVWGSVLSVQIKRQEMYDKINNQIVFDMHIPLRTIFN